MFEDNTFFLKYANLFCKFGNLWRFRSVICGIKKRNIYWLTQIDKKQEFGLINNINNFFSTTFARATTQHALKKNNKNCYKKKTKTISRLKAKTT